MRLSAERHLSYCSNVHPGESFEELWSAVLPSIVEVKRRNGSAGDFGLGLRLSAAATAALSHEAARVALREFLAREGLYAFSFNGFPFGQFHGGRIKEAVYRPDWRAAERRLYSDQLAELLAELLPDDLGYGSISTVPFGFRAEFARPSAFREAAEQLLQHVAFLHRLRQRTGKRVVLALEPEPFCALETSRDCVQVFDAWLRSPDALQRLATLCGESRATAKDLLHDHVGVCLDTCHAAVAYEDPRELVRRLSAHEIPIYKVQLSAGLRIVGVSDAQRTALRAFAEDTYLHQVLERGAHGLVRYLDLPDALDSGETRDAREWRVHFHVPIFRESYGLFGSTQADMIAQIVALGESECRHFEVETYTWNVLPPSARGPDLIADVVNELSFAARALEGR